MGVLNLNVSSSDRLANDIELFGDRRLLCLIQTEQLEALFIAHHFASVLFVFTSHYSLYICSKTT
jgi:hypothetical protein